MRSKIASLLITLFAVASFATSPNYLDLDVSAKKVSKERNQIAISFTVTALESFSFSDIQVVVFGEGVQVLEILPEGMFSVDPIGTAGYATIILPTPDRLYSVVVTAKDQANRYSAQKVLYFRNEQGNGLLLTEAQYNNFAESHRAMWQNSQAAEHAKADLEELRARGLAIAVENWPKEEEFAPLQNSIGDAMQVHQNDIYEIALNNEAVTNPRYKDIVTVQIAPPGGDIIPCYYANLTYELPQQEPLCINTLAQIKIVTRLYNPSSGILEDWPQMPISAGITYRGLAEDRCSGDCKPKTFYKDVTLNLNGTTEGVAYPVITKPPSSSAPLLSIKIKTKNDYVSAGQCHSATGGGIFDVDCWSSHPEWTSGSENIYLWQPGSYNSSAMVRWARCDASSSAIPECDGFREQPGDLIRTHYVAVVDIKEYPNLDTSIKPHLLPIFEDLNTMLDFWQAHSIPAQYVSMRACPYQQYAAGTFNHNCSTTPIISLDMGQCFSDVAYHEGGHWLQYKMQGNHIDGGGNWSPCGISSPGVAFSEGFAEWHQLRMTQTGDMWDIPCGHDYDSYQVSMDHVQAACFNFMWDVFDSIDAASDHLCDVGQPPDACGDTVTAPVSSISQWIGHSYNTVGDFISGWKQAGMPFNGIHDTICKLQDSHGLKTNDCP